MKLSEDLKASLAQGLRGTSYGDALQCLHAFVEGMAESGEIAFGPDTHLGDHALEVRTRLILSALGFAVSKGRDGKEDLVVSSTLPGLPLVIEVKSSRKPQLLLDNLRQLDDWVFDLSGEETARISGLAGRSDPLAIATLGLASRTRHHPSPHKGVMIFNGPIGKPFTERESPLSPNDADYVRRHNFCVVPFGILATLATTSPPPDPKALWSAIQQTSGVLSLASQ